MPILTCSAERVNIISVIFISERIMQILDTGNTIKHQSLQGKSFLQARPFAYFRLAAPSSSQGPASSQLPPQVVIRGRYEFEKIIKICDVSLEIITFHML